MGHVWLNHSLSTHPAAFQCPGEMGYYLQGLLISNHAGHPGILAPEQILDLEPNHRKRLQAYDSLIAAGLWKQLDDGSVECPQYVPSHGSRGIRLWKKGVIGPVRAPVPQWMRQIVFERDGWACVYCGGTDRLEADHIHPYSKGGPTILENLQTLCKICNIRKGAKV